MTELSSDERAELGKRLVEAGQRGAPGLPFEELQAWAMKGSAYSGANPTPDQSPPPSTTGEK